MWGRCTVVGECSEHGTVLERSASPSIARYSRSTDCIFLPILNVKEIERRLIEGMFCFCFDVLASRISLPARTRRDRTTRSFAAAAEVQVLGEACFNS